MKARSSAVAFLFMIACSGHPSSNTATPDAGNTVVPTRTVTGAFATVFIADDGSRISNPVNDTGADTKIVAAWVPSASGWTRIAASTAPQPPGGFAIEGVSEGVYYLEVDQDSPDFGILPQPSFNASFYPFTGNTPDLSSVRPGRGNRTPGPSPSTFLDLSIDNLTPWNPGPQNTDSFFPLGDRLTLVGSQDALAVSLAVGPALPQGATTATKRVTLDGAVPESNSLPDASKGDVEFIYQMSTTAVGSGATAGTVGIVSRFARIDDLTVLNSMTTTRNVTLGDAGRTASFQAKLTGSAWAGLLAQANPAMTAVPGGQFFGVRVYPNSAGFPDQPASFGFQTATVVSPPLADVDYGTTLYGQFLGTPWQEIRRFDLQGSVALPQPGTLDKVTTSGVVFESEELMPAPANLVPLLGPPQAPMIQGLDAFQAHSGVGLTPLISWSAPSVGTPTSYQVGLGVVQGNPKYRSLIFNVYGATSLQIPPGLLESGSTYQLSISALAAPWDTVGRAPLRHGAPYATAQAVGAVFAP
jgi:hypothetical protein